MFALAVVCSLVGSACVLLIALVHIVRRRAVRDRAIAASRRDAEVEAGRRDAILALQPADLEYLVGLGWIDPYASSRRPAKLDPWAASCVCGHSDEPHDPAVHAATTYPNLGDQFPWEMVAFHTHEELRNEWQRIHDYTPIDNPYTPKGTHRAEH